ncbi:hypothetical protein [Altericista sp. CCNU0014]|uniref:hypothetical protein n=1 Tax=Altericista sp. CCNU0014 TaxID=3082949 RepID=UPI00384EC64A
MTEPIFWLVCSLLLVAVCLTAVLVTAIPALKELARASRSAEKLFDTLYRELPPTLEAIRLTGSEISNLTDDLSDGVESAGNVVKQVDRGLQVAQRQVKEAGITTQSFWIGVRAAWKTFTKPSSKPNRRSRYDRASDADRYSTGDRIAPRVRPSATSHPQAPADLDETASAQLNPSSRSRAKKTAAVPSEKHLETLPEPPSAAESD